MTVLTGPRAVLTAALAAVPGTNLLRLNLDRNRLCLCRGRPHARNRPFLLVDRERGCFWQKCLDPDCRHFRSGPFPIPASVLDGQW